MSLVESLTADLEQFKLEYAKFERGNKSAGTRARTLLQGIRKTAQELRVAIQNAKKSQAEKTDG